MDDEYLLLNPCYGSMAFVDKEVVEFLSNLKEGKQTITPTSEIINELSDKGFLTEKTAEEEIDFAENLKNTFYRRQNLVKHGFVVTYDCNMRCIYCYESGLWKKPEEWLNKPFSEQQVDQVYEIIEQMKSRVRKARPISLYGGEPLMVENMDIVENILKKGHQKGYTFDTNTNGITIKEYIDLLEKYQVNQISITLDGPKEIHDERRVKKGGEGSFDDVVEGIDISTERGLSVGVRVNVDSTNIDELPELATLVQQRGWHEKKNLSFHICRVARSDCHDPQGTLTWDELIGRITQLRESFAEMGVFKYEWDEGQMNSFSVAFENGCPPPRDIFCLAHSAPVLIYDPYGNVYVCAKLVGKEEHKVGTYTHGLEFNDNYRLWRNRKVLNIDECRKCHSSLMCGGGCANDALIDHKSIMKPYCEEYLATVKWHVPYIYKERLKNTKSELSLP